MSSWGPVVYRVYDDADRLIYVGATRDFDGRLKMHRRSSWWMGMSVRFELEEYPDPIAAHEAEIRAIVAESPAFNINSSGKSQSESVPLTEEEQRALRAWAVSNPGYLTRLPRAFQWALPADAFRVANAALRDAAANVRAAA